MVNVLRKGKVLEGEVVYGDGNFFCEKGGFRTFLGLQDDVLLAGEGIVGPFVNATESAVGLCVGRDGLRRPVGGFERDAATSSSPSACTTTVAGI